MKNFMSLVVICFLALFVSCGGKSQDNTSAESVEKDFPQVVTAPTQKQPISFANDKFTTVEYAIIEGFTETIKETTGYEVEISSSPDTASYQTVIKQSIRDASAPGLFTWWSGPQLNALAEAGLLEDLSDIWDNYVIPMGVSADLKQSLSYNGKAYAVPFSVLYNVVFYNKNVFQAAGITSEPTTFEEFLEVCEKIKATGVSPIGLKSDSWAGFIWFQQMLSVQDPQLYLDICDGTRKYTDPEVVEAMHLWKDMLDKGYFSKPQSDWAKNIATGNLGMILEPATVITGFKRDYGLVSGEDFDSFVVPSATGKRGTVFFEVSPQSVAKASASKDDALKALESWYNKDLQTYIYDGFGIVNTNTVEISDPVFNEVMGYTADSDNYTLILRYYENTPEEIRNVALDQFMKFQLGNVGVEEMLETIQAKADEVFGN